MVKADAYGHGLRQTALAFESAGADKLSVASLDEALALRARWNRRSPILVLFPVPASGLGQAAENGIELTVTDVPNSVTEEIWRCRSKSRPACPAED